MNSSFLKWAGGKKWFISHYGKLFPKTYDRYIEPFLGGGIVFFYLEPQKALLNDINKELIITYKVIKNDPNNLLEILKKMEKKHCKEYYYKIRETKPTEDIKIAARMIYLNHTCFNGIYRVNPRGEFNVPIGTLNNVIRDNDNYEKRSKLLKNVKFYNDDFEYIIDKAAKGDLLFCDPPYAIKEGNVFVSYNKKDFMFDDQIRLAKAIDRARKRKVKIIMTNVNHKSIKELYDKTKYKLIEVKRNCTIAGNIKGRNEYKELIIITNI